MGDGQRTVTAAPVSVSAVSAAHLPALIALLRAIQAEMLPTDPDGSEHSEAEVRRSLSRFDVTQSGSCRVLLALVHDAAAGYALAVRIPKLDARVGFLYVDELYVLRSYRRGGVARAIVPM